MIRTKLFMGGWDCNLLLKTTCDDAKVFKNAWYGGGVILLLSTIILPFIFTHHPNYIWNRMNTTTRNHGLMTKTEISENIQIKSSSLGCMGDDDFTIAAILTNVVSAHCCSSLSFIVNLQVTSVSYVTLPRHQLSPPPFTISLLPNTPPSLQHQPKHTNMKAYT